MSWLARIFANALARRLAAVIVAFAFGCLASQYATAQDYSDCFNQEIPGDSSTYCPTIADAHRMVTAAAKYHGTEWAKPGSCNGNGACYAEYRGVFGNRLAERHYRSGCEAGKEFNPLRGICQTTCASRSPETVSYKEMIPNGSYSCSDGCTARITETGDGTYTKIYLGGEESKCGVLPNDCSSFGAGYTMNFATSMCQPPVVECQENDVKDPISGTCTQGCEPGKIMDAAGVCKQKEEHCPPGNVKSPSGGCLPGDGQCAAGEVKGKDGTCKRDADGDGEPDAGEEDGTSDPTFSGGDSCNSPPACSGSPILCGQARIQWRIDCNTRKDVTVTGGACSAMPVCIGKNCDALEYTQLLMQWRTACAVEKLASKDGEGGEGEDGIKDHLTAMKQAEVNALRSLGQDDGHADVDPSDIWAKDSDYGDNKLDSGLFGGGGGSCSFSFTIGGEVITPPPQFWRIVSIIHWLLIASAYLWVASKLG